MGPREIVTVIGAGSWGTALAIQLAKNAAEVRLWGCEQSDLDVIKATGINQRYLPENPLPKNISVAESLQAAVTGTHPILIVVPSHGFKDSLAQMAPFLTSQQPIIWATKGIEPSTHQLLSDIAIELLGPDLKFAVLSGPSFAKEVADGLPTAVALAYSQQQVGEQFGKLIASETFMVYLNDDYRGVQLGGAVKNVMAVATGISDGLGFGANARSAVITRGLAEMMRLGASLGAKPETFMGLAGMGDLILTCTDNQSRNRRFGLALGRGSNAKQAMEEIGQVVEGYGTTAQLYQLARQQQVFMPITEKVYQILYQGLPTKVAVQELLTPKLGVEGA